MLVAASCVLASTKAAHWAPCMASGGCDASYPQRPRARAILCHLSLLTPRRSVGRQCFDLGDRPARSAQRWRTCRGSLRFRARHAAGQGPPHPIGQSRVFCDEGLAGRRPVS